VRDAIVLSTWSWDVFNVPERIALALSMRGARVLYCEMPASKFKKPATPVTEIAKGIYAFRPELLGGKFNMIAPLRHLQWRSVAHQILDRAAETELKDPVFLYSHIRHVDPLCEEIRANHIPLVHVCMDYPEPYQYSQIALSDRTLVIPKAVGHKLKAKFGNKIVAIPQSIHVTKDPKSIEALPASLAASSRPRLGYLGSIYGRVNVSLLRELLRCHPDWQFFCFGGAATLSLPNARDLEWTSPSTLAAQVSCFDVGIMPYDCFDDRNLHCVPLKLFDYFIAGIPVVSTPIIALWEYQDLVYLGSSSEELSCAVLRALEEPQSSPKRRRRIEVAMAHSTGVLGQRLETILNFPT
jgi:hypothetical protein